MLFGCTLPGKVRFSILAATFLDCGRRVPTQSASNLGMPDRHDRAFIALAQIVYAFLTAREVISIQLVHEFRVTGDGPDERLF